MRGRTVRHTTTCSLVFVALVSVPVAAQTAAQGQVLAEVNGKTITAAEVEAALGATLAKLEEQIYNLKRQKIDQLIDERLLADGAATRGLSGQQLMDAEITAKVGLVSEQEIETFYEANKTRLPGDAAAVRLQIRAHLQNQKLATQREAFVQSLRSQARIAVHLTAPPVFRAEVGLADAPVRGPADAPVTIVEFSDFHCPFCRNVQPTLREILSRYRDKVKLVYRDFPLDSLHPQARKAAEAARCANDQGQFWAYHDKMFGTEPDGSPEKLAVLAREVGLDLAAFDGCLRSGKHQPKVQKDVEAGTRLGVSGTPAFFVNGRPLSGAQPLESFARLIEEELNQRR